MWFDWKFEVYDTIEKSDKEVIILGTELIEQNLNEMCIIEIFHESLWLLAMTSDELNQIPSKQAKLVAQKVVSGQEVANLIWIFSLQRKQRVGVFVLATLESFHGSFEKDLAISDFSGSSYQVKKI